MLIAAQIGDVEPGGLDEKLGLGTSPGLRQVLVSILVGIPVGNVTHGSGSPAATDP